MEITKPILHPSTFKYDLGNINYSDAFLKRLTKSKDVNVELNEHDGEVITKIKKLKVKDGKLYATMDIPEEHLAKDIAFSASVVPFKYKKLGIDTFEPTDGYLDSVVYVNDGTEVKDVKTITKLNNLEEGEIDMGNEGELAKKNGLLEAKVASLEKQIGKMTTKIQTLTTEAETLNQTIADKDDELTKQGKQLKTFLDEEQTKKDSIIKELLEDENDPMKPAFEKWDLSDLEAYKAKQKLANPDTPPRGVGAEGVEGGEGGEGGSEDEEKPYNYLEAKESMNIR